ncbi:HEAT repeat domain-containing protein, partial [Akkermansiaceae bacterium]|nr:HEAT repeat domain-containing protein [Akkermansiaceae bacterium]
MIFNTRTSCSLCALLLFLLPSIIEAVPEDEKKKEKIEGTANPEKFPAEDPDKALLSTITYPEEMKAGVFAKQPDILNATAICFDEQNRLYAAETHRFDRGIEDNRRNLHWLRDEIALTSTAERLEMYKKHEKIKPLSYYTEHSDKIRVLEDRDNDGKADVSKIFADEFNDPLDGTAAGIMAANGKVYYACIPHVWMLEDTNGDLKADKRTSLQEGYGISVSLSGHDLNGFTFGPDGRIYFTIGDRGYNLKTAEGSHLYDQYAGAIFRMEPDGSGLEVVHYGLRNPKEISFDQYGEAFSVDNNADMGDKARIVHIVEGATSGWHRGNQNLRNFRDAIDVNPRHKIPWMEESGWDVKGQNRPAAYLPPLTHLSTGPSGLTYNPGTGLDPKWANNFFICDYRGAKSGVIAFEMEPAGASFALKRDEMFIQGFLNTDMEFGYDGKVYVSDFTGSWRTYDLGTIFVFENEKETAKPVVAEVRSLFAEGFDKLSPEKLSSLLGHTDMRVRQRAQFTLAKDIKNRPDFIKATATGNKLVHRLHGLWGLGQLARSLGDIKSAQALAELTMDSEWRIRSQAVKALGDSFPNEFQSTSAFLLKDKHPNTQLHAAITLGKSGNPQYVPALISLLEKNKDTDTTLRHGAIQGLISIAQATKSVDALLVHAGHPSAAVRRGLVVALRRLKSDQLGRFVNDQDSSIAIEAIQAINDDYLEGARAAVANAAHLLGKASPMIDYRIINSIYRMGDEQNARR